MVIPSDYCVSLEVFPMQRIINGTTEMYQEASWKTSV